MKYQSNLPKVDEREHSKLLNEGWTPLIEPQSVMSATFRSIPFMILTTLLSAWIIIVTSSLTLKDFGITSSTDSLTLSIHVGFLIGIFLLLVVHELLHLIFVPQFLKSDKTYIGLTWFGGYVVTEEKLSKTRYLWVTAAPFIILSVLLPLVLSLIGLLTPMIKMLILLNAASSSVDMLNVVLITKQVPANATLRNNGMKTYWRKSEGERKNAGGF
ncbi:DUF3267 domain-containing protein [Alkalihalobacillus sp. CinArs1]|uniref:DUF3267 domain-containing protein n=1 Tax=Alkalihalobacillus sp. CinArs1 TaxID=2995314 RepID=UPI0022DE7E98|nr:DUF3267 domain-containing protein [Alkalihalobacillus sp. CinArs1]